MGVIYVIIIIIKSNQGQKDFAFFTGANLRLRNFAIARNLYALNYTSCCEDQ